MSELALRRVVEGDVICGATAGRCICVKSIHSEDEPHECRDQSVCRGSWYGDVDGPPGSFRVVRYPIIGGRPR